MKKIGIFLIAFLLLGSFAYAETFDVDFSGEASVTYGFDLQEETHGFLNATDATVTLTFVPEQTVESEGDGWYGWIALDFEVTNENGGEIDATASVDEARITNDSAYVSITQPADSASSTVALFGSGDAEFLGEAEGFAVLGYEAFADTFDGATVLPYADAEAAWRAAVNEDALYGITVGYGDDDIINDISVAVVSDGSWRAGTVGEDDEENARSDEYAYSFNVDVTPVDLVSFATHLFVGFNSDETETPAEMGWSIGSTSELTFHLDDVMAGFEAAVGYDVSIWTDAPDDALAPWVASLRLSQALAEGSEFVVKTAMGPQFYDGQTESDLSFDVGLLFREGTEAGFVPGFGAGLGVSLLNLGGVDEDDADDPQDADNHTLGLLADLEYDQGGINPFAGLGYHTLLDDDTDVAWVAYEVGLTLKDALHGINNTEFTARYGSWDKGDENYGLAMGDDKDEPGVHAGFLTLETKISF